MKQIFYILLLLPLFVSAQIPENYYSSVKDGQKSDAIYSALHSRISSHTILDYDDLEDYYLPIDFDKDGYLMDIYSTCALTFKDGNKSQDGVCDAWNKEHTIPQDWFSGSGIRSDLFHVYPTDACVNGARSDLPYGENEETGLGLKSGKDPDHHGLGSIGSNTFGSYSVGKVYEPDDQFKGDIARNYFYMVTCYSYSSFTGGNGAKMFTSTYFTDFALNLLLKWHRQDPVSQKEIDRNNGVYKVQKNRNPFIDYPYLVEYIWGDMKGQTLDLSQIISSEDPSFIPGKSDGHLESTDPMLRCKDTTVIFPTLVAGEQSTVSITLQAYRMTNAVSCTVTGTDAEQFSVSPAFISQEQATGTHTISVTYSPTNKAIHTAKLTISSEGANTLNISLSGACATECQVRWLVDGIPYAEGDPTTSVVMGGKLSAMPAAPNACSELSQQFVGWTDRPIADSTDNVPAVLFANVKDAPVIDENKTFHAVFAHMTTIGSSTPSILTWTSPSAAGWTVSKTKSTNGYHVLITGASITSPAVDLSALQSVTIKMRTYGGTSNGKVDIAANGSWIASLTAQNSTMAEKIWKNTSSLTGTYPLIFTSSTNGSSAGPGLEAISIQSEGTKYIYSRYITTCISTDLTPITHHPSPITKFLKAGRLYIQVNNQIYDIHGQIVQ